jgi:hypothetical protein
MYASRRSVYRTLAEPEKRAKGVPGVRTPWNSRENIFELFQARSKNTAANHIGRGLKAPAKPADRPFTLPHEQPMLTLSEALVYPSASKSTKTAIPLRQAAF